MSLDDARALALLEHSEWWLVGLTVGVLFGLFVIAAGVGR